MQNPSEVRTPRANHGANALFVSRVRTISRNHHSAVMVMDMGGLIVDVKNIVWLFNTRDGVVATTVEALASSANSTTTAMADDKDTLYAYLRSIGTPAQARTQLSRRFKGHTRDCQTRNNRKYALFHVYNLRGDRGVGGANPE